MQFKAVKHILVGNTSYEPDAIADIKDEGIAGRLLREKAIVPHVPESDETESEPAKPEPVRPEPVKARPAATPGK